MLPAEGSAFRGCAAKLSSRYLALSTLQCDCCHDLWLCMQALPGEAECEQEGKVVCAGGHIQGQTGGGDQRWLHPAHERTAAATVAPSQPRLLFCCSLSVQHRTSCIDAVFMLTSCANRALAPGSCTLSPEGLPGPVLHKTRGGALRKTGAVALRHHHKGGSRHAGCDP